MTEERIMLPDSRQTGELAKKLAACSDDLVCTEKELDRIMQDLRLGWDADAAGLYLAKCEQLKEKLSGSSFALSRLAAAVLRAGEVFPGADRDGLRNSQAGGERGRTDGWQI